MKHKRYGHTEFLGHWTEHADESKGAGANKKMKRQTSMQQMFPMASLPSISVL